MNEKLTSREHQIYLKGYIDGKKDGKHLAGYLGIAFLFMFIGLLISLFEK